MTPKEAVALLRKYTTSEKSYQMVSQHCQKVAEIALRFAGRIPDVDLNLVECGALLHDIGRFQCPPNSSCSAEHGFVGAELLRKEGIDRKLVLIVERHVGTGITIEDIRAQGLKLPLRNFLPLTTEEKIVAHADNLCQGTKEWTLQDAVDRFARELGPLYGERVRKLGEEVERLSHKP